jgi:hypothetical protein
MVPGELHVASFTHYPPQARTFAVANLSVLQRMPLILIALVLRQMIQYDWCFPAEREELSHQLDLFRQMDASAFDTLVAPFASIQLSPELRRFDWVGRPQQFSEQLTAYLWSQHQIDHYHQAAQDYELYLQKAFEKENPAAPRWTIVALGQGTGETDRPLFRQLLSRGTLFTEIDPAGALDVLLAEVCARAQRYPLEYGHWYIEGGEPHALGADAKGVSVISYDNLVPVTKREFVLLNQFTNRPGNDGTAQVEAVSSYLAGLSPEDLGLKGTAIDDVLRHFEVNVLTQGAGCQIYSTTFVQWASRECLHRAQPLTLFARFATRQASAPMEQLMARDPLRQPQDKAGSLVDADMGAYYTWINQSRLVGADQSRFLVWFEGHRLACAISPTLPGGKTSETPTTMRQVLDWMG